MSIERLFSKCTERIDFDSLSQIGAEYLFVERWLGAYFVYFPIYIGNDRLVVRTKGIFVCVGAFIVYCSYEVVQ